MKTKGKITRKMVEAKMRTYRVSFSGSSIVNAENEMIAERLVTSQIFGDTLTIESIDEEKSSRR